MKRVLFDINVLLDVLLKREPHFAASARALDTVGRTEVAGYLAAHAVTTLFYLLRREVGARRALTLLSDLLVKLHVAPVTDAGVRHALAEPLGDFEDAVTRAAASEVSASVIVTRNVRDFGGSAIPAVLPDVFWQV